jgi:phage terminase small subunit
MHRRKHPHGKLTIIGRAQQYKFIRPKKAKHPTWLDQTNPRAFQQQENVNPFDDQASASVSEILDLSSDTGNDELRQRLDAEKEAREDLERRLLKD